MGVESSYSDGLLVDGLKAVGNNTEHFNPAPGLWSDESVYDGAAVGTDIRNTGDG